MEKSTSNEKVKINESLILTNRKILKLEGIIEVNSSSESLISTKLKDTTLTITGQNLHIARLDIALGLLDIEGNIECIKYGKSTNIFKRIFK